MREYPPARLVDLLGRLDLATPAQVRSVYGRARRLARELPLFESVWVDALAQSRLITQFHAAELNADRGEMLGVGPYVLLDRLDSSGYAENFRAREKTTDRVIRLILPLTHQRRPAEIAQRLEKLIEKSRGIEHESLALMDAAGADGKRTWASCPLVEATSAAEWMIQEGRFPPEVALEIARQMAVALRWLERHETVHGDLHCRDLSITSEGRVVLSAAGLRGAVRPEEGFGHADLPPEAYDYLAPERITLGTPPSVRSDLYACGYVWWHLLTGRPPFLGGNSLTKLRAVASGKAMDIGQIAPDAPAALVAAIAACTSRDPSHRPESFAQVVETLGTPIREGRNAVARLMWHGRRVVKHETRQQPSYARPSPAVRLTAVSAVVGAISLIALAAWRYTRDPSIADRVVTVQGEIGAAPAADEGQQATTRQTGASRSPTPSLGAQGSGRTAIGASEHALYRPRQVAGAVVAASADTLDSRRGRAPDDEQADVRGDHVTAPSETGRDRIVLPADRPVRWDEISLVAGAIVLAADGGRTSVVVPFEGLRVEVENVRFERIDFVRDEASPGDAIVEHQQPVSASGAFVHLRALEARFDECSFDAGFGKGALPAAILWETRSRPADDQIALPTGVLKMNHCAFRGVAMGIECRTSGALVLETNNLLFLGPGPLLCMFRVPSIEEPVVLSLRRTTLRGAAAIVDCWYSEIDEEPGGISIRSLNCVFSPLEGGALLSFHGEQNPDALVSALRWTGQGSLMTPEAAVVHWHAANDQTHKLAEEGLNIAGLVRSEVRFAGHADDGAAASQVVRWQVPLRSLEPPGVGELPFELPAPGQKDAATVVPTD